MRKSVLHKLRKTILVVEDDRAARKVCRTMLTSMGHDVLEAGTGSQAMEICNSHEGQIDLAIIDLLLPDGVGDKIFKKIKKKRPNIKVIFSSGYPVYSDVQDSLNINANRFIQKPYDLLTLTEAIRSVCSKDAKLAPNLS